MPILFAGGRGATDTLRFIDERFIEEKASPAYRASTFAPPTWNGPGHVRIAGPGAGAGPAVLCTHQLADSPGRQSVGRDLDQFVSDGVPFVAAQVPYAHEHRLRDANGSYRWHRSRAMPVTKTGNAVHEWVGISIGIHEQKIWPTAADTPAGLTRSQVRAVAGCSNGACPISLKSPAFPPAPPYSDGGSVP